MSCLGQGHPVQQDTVCDRAADPAKVRPHRRYNDSCLIWKKLTQLCDRLPNDLDRFRQLTGPDSDPESRWIEAESLDLSHDPDRLVAVKGKYPDTQLEVWRS